MRRRPQVGRLVERARLHADQKAGRAGIVEDAPATERAEMRVLGAAARRAVRPHRQFTLLQRKGPARQDKGHAEGAAGLLLAVAAVTATECSDLLRVYAVANRPALTAAERSEEHTSELQSLMRISYSVFC